MAIVASLQPRCKIWLLGEATVGKTTMMQSLLTNSAIHSKIYRQTQETDLNVYRQKHVEMYVLDVAGDGAYREVVDAHLARNDAAALIFCYDVTNQESVSRLKRWLSLAKQLNKARPAQNGLLPIAIVGLKTDLNSRRTVTTQQGENLAAKLAQGGLSKKIRYFEATSRKPGSIQDVFNWVGDVIQGLNSHQQTKNALKMMEDPAIEAI